MQSVNIHSLAISFPQTIRTNQYWLEKFPQMFAQTKQRQVRRTKSADLIPTNNGIDLWLQEVAPYMTDPFRGSVKRCVLASDESSLMLECRAAQAALQAANLAVDDIDLAIVAALFPSDVGPGMATHLARKIGLRCPAWNLESTCASALIALQTAQAFLQTGTYRQILIVVSHIGSQAVDDVDTLSWSMGDGAGAMVVGNASPGRGILSTKIVPTIATCGAYAHELTIDAQGHPRIQTVTGENVSSLAETAADTVRQCCQEAVAAAGVSLDQIDYFAFNTPTAWYARVCAKALGIDPERAIDLYPTYANIGPVFPIANLYHAAARGKIRDNDLVLVYANGAGATAVATVIRWGNVTIADYTAESVTITPDNSTVPPENDSFAPPAPDLVAIPETNIQQKLLAMSLIDRHATLQNYLLAWLANLHRLMPSDLSTQDPLTTLLDSLTAVVFRSHIETNLQIRVPMEKFLGDSNIQHLTEFLLDRLAISGFMASAAMDITISDREVFSL